MKITDLANTDKQTATGSYDLESIKYFRSVGVELNVVCPHCGYKMKNDAGDDFIEYPAEHNKLEWCQCWECEREFTIFLDIEMKVKIEYWTEKGITDETN